MKSIAFSCAVILAALVSLSAAVSPVEAAGMTSAQKKELSSLLRDIRSVHSEVRKKNLDEADKIIEDVEKRLKKLGRDAGLSPNSTALSGPRKAITAARYALEMKRDPKAARRLKSGYVSFVKRVAPILQAKCLSCHGYDGSGGLSMMTFAAMKKGGAHGPVLAVGNWSRSLIMLRICARDESQRMPPTGGRDPAPPVTRAEVNILATWISQGADFDGDDEEMELPELTAPKVELPPIKFDVPTGSETVSFGKDIGPIFVRNCIRCHTKKKPEGGLNLETFELLIRGGESGSVVRAGQPDQSRLFKLVDGAFEEMEMPYGERLIPKADREKIKTWIAEGIKYDGGDPALPLRALNPSDDQIEIAEMSKLTPEQLAAYREKRTAEQWKKAFPDESAQSLSSDDFVLYGNVPEERLQQTAKWADKHAETLRELFGIDEEAAIWEGRLAVFVLKDREGYEGFNQAILERKMFPEVFGNAQVTGSGSDVFVALQDTGDDSDEQTPPLQFSLINHLTEAYVKVRVKPSDTPFPEWFAMGLGPALASMQMDRRDDYVEGLRSSAAESLSEIKKPEDVFDDSVFFSVDQVRPIGFTLVEFLLKRGKVIKLRSFVESYESGGSQQTALMTAYKGTMDGVAKGYLSTVHVKKKKSR